MNSPEHKRGLIFYHISTKVLTQSNAFRVHVENGLEDVFFLHFSLVSIQFDIS